MKKLYLCLVLFAGILFSTVQAADAYVLGPGDQIEFKVYGQDDLTVNTLLSNSGLINYPFLGQIKVTGLSVKKVEQLIYRGLVGDYLIEPNVYVHVTQYRPFYIHGEVNKPGGYSYQPGMTVNQAIALAGGLTDRASEEKVFIYKESDKDKQINASLTYRVNAGDTITIEQRFF
ncbi:MAG: polysaccharide export protein [Moritella sp.]|uniref:polysaccharide biosynthesis/export family protein n=1 Tax=Moritella sp. TaxID=78556 RepID=UPI001D1F7D8A|nr:polysaccharide biosynthesis/export family protein [Moritella sp.]NQZ48903.1 polysaccharide export protein [Moritella sp.]